MAGYSTIAGTMTLETHRHPDVVREFADHVPDLAPWVDVRGALLCGRSIVVSGRAADSFAVIAPHIPLVCVVGHPTADADPESRRARRA